MNLWRTLFLCSLFFLDVQVRAETHSETHEKECWGLEVPCAIFAHGGNKKLEAKGVVVVLAPGALVLQKDERTLQVVAGTIYTEVSQSIDFSTPYGRFWCVEKCRALLTRSASRIEIKSLGGHWSIKRLGDDQVYGLKSGTQMWISEVGLDGMADMEFPQSLPWLATVKEWVRLYPGQPEDLKKAMVQFRAEWKVSVDSASKMSEVWVSRVIASHNQELARQAARRKAQEREEAALREQFRKQNYLDF